MPLPFLAAGLAILLGVKAHSKAGELNEQAKNIAEHAETMYEAQRQQTQNAKKQVLKELTRVGQQKKMILLHPMQSFLASYGKLKKVGLVNSQGIDELSRLPQFPFEEKDALQLEQLTDVYQSVGTSAAEGAAVGALAGLAVTGTGTILSASAGAATAAGVAGATLDVAGTALGAVAAAPLSLFVAPVAIFTGLSAYSQAKDNLSKAKTNLAEAEEACEEMKTTAVLCEGIVKKAKMYEQLMMALTELFCQSVALQNAIIQKKEKKSRSFFNRWRGSSRSFTDEELKVFAVSRSLAGALKALIDVPMLDDGKISQAAEAKYQAVDACLPAYRQDVKAVNIAHRSLRKSARKEQDLLLAPVAESLIDMHGMVKPTGFFASGWANKALVYTIRSVSAVLLLVSAWNEAQSYLLQFVLCLAMYGLAYLDQKYSFWYRDKLNRLEILVMYLASLILMGHGISLLWSHGRYLMGFAWLMFGLCIAVAGVADHWDEEDNDNSPLDYGFTGHACMVPLIILLGGLVGKIWDWL